MLVYKEMEGHAKSKTNENGGNLSYTPKSVGESRSVYRHVNTGTEDTINWYFSITPQEPDRQTDKRQNITASLTF